MENDNGITEYGDTGIKSADRPIPRWLIYNYIFWPLFGFITAYFYWNGSYGWLDRGYWFQLQRAANTTFPQIEQNKDQYTILNEELK